MFVFDKSGERADFECGMGDFLAGILTEAIAPLPVAMFQAERPTYLSDREEHRRREAGLDCWPSLS